MNSEVVGEEGKTTAQEMGEMCKLGTALSEVM